jgi:hypothetical protein
MAALKIQVKLVHCWDVRESNWYTQIFIYALNKDRPPILRPRTYDPAAEAPGPSKNCLVQLLKDRGWI